MNAVNELDSYARRDLRQALKRVDPSIFENVLQYLEADPKTFSSGYRKSMMWRYIRRYDLNDTHIRRLEIASLQYLKRPMRPEYKRMCQVMTYIGSSAFWYEVQMRLESPETLERLNAYCLYQYANGMNVGERKRLEMKQTMRELRRMKYRKYPSWGRPIFSGGDVLDVIQNTEMWQNNQIIYRQPDENDLPLIRFGRHENLATFDYTYCYPEKVINALSHVLWEASYGDMLTTWVYICYVYGELQSVEAIPILKGFYETRIQYLFENAIKWYTTQAICRALERINTPESRQLAKKYQYPDTHLDGHLKKSTTGWLLNVK